MPIAFREWAVTVRALAEGEQLLTLRRERSAEANRPLKLAHERFFLYPTFDAPVGRPRARVPPARAAPRARGGSVERRRARAAHVRVGRAHPAARPRAHPRVGRGHRPLHDHGPALRGRAVAVLRVDARLRRQAPRMARAPAAARAAAAHLPHPAARHREGQGRVRGPERLGASSRANCRSRAPRCSPTRSSIAPPKRSARSQAKRPASRSSSERRV